MNGREQASTATKKANSPMRKTRKIKCSGPPHPYSRGSDVAGSVGKCRWLIEFKYNTKCIFHDAAL